MCHFFGRAIVFKEIDGSFGQPLIEEWFEFRERYDLKHWLSSQGKRNADESVCLVNELVTLRNKRGKILLNGVCTQPSLTTGLLIHSQQNRFWFALKM